MQIQVRDLRLMMTGDHRFDRVMLWSHKSHKRHKSSDEITRHLYWSTDQDSVAGHRVLTHGDTNIRLVSNEGTRSIIHQFVLCSLDTGHPP